MNLPHDHLAPPVTGILLTNLGTPDAPTPPAVRRYLAQFLADPRIDTGLPRWLWWMILHGIILRTRPRKTAALYQVIWEVEGSPLLRIAKAQATAVETALQANRKAPVKVALGMRYGNPSIADALRQLRAANAQRLLVLPLYPQYASATTASTLDAVFAELQTWRWLPELRCVTHYHDHPGYLQSLAQSIRDYWQTHGGPPAKLLLSFHGIPQRVFLDGDPYYCECHKTARLLAERLGLRDDQWKVTFQSRFGKEPWLQPYTDETLRALGEQQCPRVDVACPGFSADCLETLEEISHTNRQIFQHAGGGEFHYIPALNDRPDHIEALTQIVEQQLWSDATIPEAAHQDRARRAEALAQLG